MTVVDPTAGTTTTTGAEVPPPPARVRLRVADRLAAATGAAFVGMILAGNSMTESVVGADASPAGTVADLVAQGGSAAARTGLVLEVLGLFCLTVFSCWVAAVGLSRPIRGTGSGWPVLAAVAAGLVVAVKLASAAPYLAALASAETLPAETLHALVETNGTAFVLTWLPLAVLVGAVAVVLRRAGLVGRVLAGSGAVLAVLGFAAGLLGVTAPASALPVPFLLSLLWTAAVGLRVSLRG